MALSDKSLLSFLSGLALLNSLASFSSKSLVGDSSGGLDEAFSGYYDSSSSDGAASSAEPSSKNIVSERNRRKKFNERLFALRSVVPNISKDLSATDFIS